MMDEKYTGKAQDRRYVGSDADILYNVKRCIHAEECIQRLASVFDAKKRPWITPTGAPVEAIVEVIPKCPSGALHYERKDGGLEETAPPENTITLWADGPVQFHGDLIIEGATVELKGETRATLCRCGASENKPFCL